MSAPTLAQPGQPRSGSRPGRAPTRFTGNGPPPPRLATSSPSQTRSESQPGSRAPLLRRPAQARDSSLAAAAAPAAADERGRRPAATQVEAHADGEAENTARDAITQQRDPEKADKWLEAGAGGGGDAATSSSPRQNGSTLARLARHFVGVRGERALPAPLIRPVRHLSPDLETYLLTFLGSFPSILIACGISYALSHIYSDDGISAFAATPLTVGSFGATAVLLYATPEAPLSQPRNVILGQTLSAIIGAVMSELFSLDGKFTEGLRSGEDNTIATGQSWPSLVPVSGALSVGLATLGMQLTGTVHPPGGATALIAAYHRTTGPRYTYILDVFLSVTAMTIWALFVNNLGRRRYPTHWWVPKKPATPSPPQPGPSPPSASSTSSNDTAVAPTSAPVGAVSSAAPRMRSLSRSRSGVSPRLDPAADLDVDPSLAGEEVDDSTLPRRRSTGRGGEEEEVFTPLEDAERRWLGRLGEEDEEALGGTDEQARREAVEWERGRSLERESERGRRR
ncbi:hypothetical protein JCM10908_001493 [Rhodotorula pacifica]|uniref:HPP family protein n=1 Tax=Rhodotorula pacifica TaxID=1495444 RepID=UPI003177A115